jgi:hypothetical protein
MLTWYIVVENESGDKVKVTDVPKDVEVVVDEYITDMEGN